MRLFIGSSSREEIEPLYMEDCKKLLDVILKEHDLIFGACNKGLMGLCYQIAKANGRSITGICPEFYKDSLKDLDCDHEIVTKTMLESTFQIFEYSDAILLIPGGLGSLYEFFTSFYSKICKEIDCPIILYNSCGYYDLLIQFLQNAVKSGFVSEKDLNHLFIANSIDDVLNYLSVR